MTPVRVLIADDEPLARERLAMLLADRHGGREALAQQGAHPVERHLERIGGDVVHACNLLDRGADAGVCALKSNQSLTFCLLMSSHASSRARTPREEPQGSIEEAYHASQAVPQAHVRKT